MRLEEYLEKFATPMTVLSRKSGVSEVTLRSILKGRADLFLSVGVAIEKATDGMVKCTELLDPVLSNKPHGNTKQEKNKNGAQSKTRPRNSSD